MLHRDVNPQGFALIAYLHLNSIDHQPKPHLVETKYHSPPYHSTMVRHTKNLGAIHIAWGYDDACIGYFFTVYDDRLRWQRDQSSEVDSVTEKVSMDDGGNYFDLNTYRIGGFGHKVSEKMMFTFMRRYGINPDKIMSHDGGVGEGTGGVKECANPDCRMLETVTAYKRCAKCRNAWYCSKACQTTDWISHKAICIEA